MISLAHQQPIYVCGSLPGAAQWAGRLLGLDATWKGRPAGFDADVLIGAAAEEHAHHFRPPPRRDLPLDRRQLIAFLEQHALGSTLWPDNGLTELENRELFKTDKPESVAELVSRGLHRRFAENRIKARRPGGT